MKKIYEDHKYLYIRYIYIHFYIIYIYIHIYMYLYVIVIQDNIGLHESKCSWRPWQAPVMGSALLQVTPFSSLASPSQLCGLAERGVGVESVRSLLSSLQEPFRMRFVMISARFAPFFMGFSSFFIIFDWFFNHF